MIAQRSAVVVETSISSNMRNKTDIRVAIDRLIRYS